MRNARKRRLKRKHGNVPAKPRQYATIKPRISDLSLPPITAARPVALAPKPQPLTLEQL